jgi:peptidoglycan/xylan/chitin deacetylase (PgdA/CDA1 family)
LGLAACGDSPARPAEESLDLVVVGEASFAAQVAAAVPVSVRVVDGSGQPRAGVAVRWSVAGGGGEFVSADASSDWEGRAGAVWRLGSVAGVQLASASIDSDGTRVVAEVAADAYAGPTASMMLTADSALISAHRETLILVPSFTDAYGNVSEAAPVTWTSSDTGVATIAPDGLVTGRDTGVTWVKGSVESWTDSLLVTVSLRGAITVTFDDGWRTTYTQAFPLLREFGIAANVGLNPATVTWADFLRRSDLEELNGAGWSIVSHTMSHAHLPDLNDEELDYELRASKEFLDGQGFRGSEVLIVPYHDWGARERTVAARYYRAARAVTASSFWPRDSLVSWMPVTPFDLTGMEADSLPYTTAAGRERLRALLQRTVDEGVFVDIFFHKVPPENVDALRETLSVLEPFKDRVLPYHLLFPPVPREVR